MRARGIRREGQITTADEDAHILQMIKQVLFTNPGERVNRPDFGCGLKQLVFAPASDALAAATQQLVHGALLQWLSNVILVESVDVEVGDGALTVTVVYIRRDTGELRQRVRGIYEIPGRGYGDDPTARVKVVSDRDWVVTLDITADEYYGSEQVKRALVRASLAVRRNRAWLAANKTRY